MSNKPENIAGEEVESLDARLEKTLELFIEARVAYEGPIPEDYESIEEFQVQQKNCADWIRSKWCKKIRSFKEQVWKDQFSMFQAGMNAQLQIAGAKEEVCDS